MTWKLGWKHINKKIIAQENTTTFFISDQETLVDVIRFLKKIGYSFVTKVEFDDIYPNIHMIGKKDNDEIIVHKHYTNFVVITHKGLDYMQFFNIIFNEFGDNFVINVTQHKHKTLTDDSFIYRQITGITKEESDIPSRYYTIYKGKKIIGKVYIHYNNDDIEVQCPTIKYFEIDSKYRGLGYGRKVLEFIEKQEEYNGYSQISCNDCYDASSFWEHMGYDVDFEDGIKDLF